MKRFYHRRYRISKKPGRNHGINYWQNKDQRIPERDTHFFDGPVNEITTNRNIEQEREKYAGSV
jgi:hypothetical protein